MREEEEGGGYKWKCGTLCTQRKQMIVFGYYIARAGAGLWGKQRVTLGEWVWEQEMVWTFTAAQATNPGGQDGEQPLALFFLLCSSSSV